MKRNLKLWLVTLCCAAVGFAGAAREQKESKPVDPPIKSDVHSELFKAPKSQNVGAQTQQLTAGLESPAGGEVVRRNFIDDAIFSKMERDGVPHAALSSDQEFVRRVRLDLTGRLPSPSDVQEFLADESHDKRARLIDRLVGSPEFVDKWAYFLMDTLRVQGKANGYKLFHYWLKQSLAADRPYDDLARAILAASAKSNRVVAAVNAIVREHVEGKPGQVAHGDDLAKVHQLDTHDELTIQFGKVFLGVNLSCISCHDGANHLEKVNVYLTGKTRSDFFRQAAFLGRTRYIPHVERSEAIMGHFIVDDFASGYDTEGSSMLRLPRSGGLEEPKFILTDEAPSADSEPREELARMLTSDPQFARASANLFWSKLMGFGIVEPYDEFDLARLDPENVPEGWEVQPSHPQLLEELGAYFRENNYSLHTLFTTICNSSAYQLSSRFDGEWNDTYTKYFARKYARMLTAEELHDAIVSATDLPGEFDDNGEKLPMAMQLSVPKPKGSLKSFMLAFGQSNRNTVARPPTASPLQPIMLMRSSVVIDRVESEEGGRVKALLDRHTDDSAVIEELFLASVSRAPTPAEKDIALTAMADNRVEGAQNVQWALLNLTEFLYNF